MTTILDLNNREMNAVLSGELTGWGTLQADLREQRQIKEELMEAYRTHIATHGC